MSASPPNAPGCGYRVKRDVVFLPLSALTGANVLERTDPKICDWCKDMAGGRSLIETLDNIVLAGRDPNAPVRLPVIDRYTDRGLIVMAKVESGTVVKGMDLVIAPSGLACKVEAASHQRALDRSTPLS